MSDAVPVDLARSRRIVEIMSDFEKLLSWIASIQISPHVQYYNDPCNVVLQHCKVEAHQLLCEPFEAFDTPARTQDRCKVQLRRYVFHGSYAFTACKLDSVANTDPSIRILNDATVRRHRAYRLRLRMEMLLQWAASRRAALHDQTSQSFDVTRLHRIDAHWQTVSRRRRTEAIIAHSPVEKSLC